MSDDPTPREPAPSATLSCAAGVSPETLSAWRDGLLSADEAVRLASHTLTCPACGARLREYDAIGAALREQIIPRSAADPWPAMRRRIEDEDRGRRGRLAALPRWGGLGALVAAALLVALFAGLLAQQATRRPGASATATVSRAATPAAPAPGVWRPVSGYQNVAGLAVAPSDPRVAYRFLLDQSQQKGSPNTLVFQRTDDEGATWHDLTPPTIAGSGVDLTDGPFTGFVSPINPSVIFLIAGAQVLGGCPSNGVAQGSYCQLEYVSADAGATWQPLILPTRGLVTEALVAQGDSLAFAAGAVRAQGSRLYASVVYQVLGAQSAPPGGRLVVSDDGGLTWRLADGPIAAAGQRVYDYAPTPSGSTIFVASVPSDQPTGGPMLWRSDDAGATWVRLGPSPNRTIIDMRAAVNQRTGLSLLYLLTAQSDGQILIQGSRNGDNGGFIAAPPLNVSQSQAPTFLTTMPDGSLVVANGGQIEAWNLLVGGVSWKQVAQPVDLVSYTSAFSQPQPNGSTLLWLAGMSATAPTVEVARLPG